MAAYGVGTLLLYPPPKRGLEVLDAMERSLDMLKPLQIQLHRGAGKSAYCQLFIMYQIATGKRRYPVIISANQRASNQLLSDIFRFVTDEGTAFVQDYPTLSRPFLLTNGSYRRRQMYRGVPTYIQKNASDMSFAQFPGMDGQPHGCHISARAITGGLRGMRKGSQRVDSILLDDLLGDDDTSEEMTQKLLDIVHKSVLNLGGSNSKINCTMTSTPIAPDDLTQRLKQDPGWSCVTFPAVINWGRDMTENDGRVWDQYWDMYDDESVQDMDHSASDAWYREHMVELEDGIELYNPDAFSPGENVDAVQALMQRRHLIGADSFACEYNLAPKKVRLAFELSVQEVLQKVGSTAVYQVPDGAQLVVASTDLNVSHCLTTSVVAFDRSMTGTVVFHETYRCRIPGQLPDTEYQQKVYELLTKYGKRLAGLPVKIDAWAIDAGGSNFQPVCDFAKNSVQLTGLRACAFLGKASHYWSENVKSRLRSASGRSVLCGDERERLKSGAGRKWVNFDSDLAHLTAQKSLKLPPGAVGGLALARGFNWNEFARQVTNEKLLYVQRRPDGRDVYNWKTKSATDHDALDTVGQAYACAWTQSLGTEMTRPLADTDAPGKRRELLRRLRGKNRIKVV